MIMNQVLGQDVERGAARIELLRNSCDKVEELGYTKAIPSERLEELKNQLVDVSIQIKDVKADAKESARQYKEQLKQLETEQGKITDQLKARSEYVMEQCFKIVDQELGRWAITTPTASWFTSVRRSLMNCRKPCSRPSAPERMIN